MQDFEVEINSSNNNTLVFHPTGTRGRSRCWCRRWCKYTERIWNNIHPPTWSDNYHVFLTAYID